MLSYRSSDGRIVAEIKNAAGPTNPNTVWFLPGHTALGIEAIDDADNNGVPEVAVLTVRDSDGRLLVDVKSVSGPANANRIWFPAGFEAIELGMPADADLNGVEELALLTSRNSDGRIVVQVRNAAGEHAPKFFWFLP